MKSGFKYFLKNKSSTVSDYKSTNTIHITNYSTNLLKTKIFVCASAVKAKFSEIHRAKTNSRTLSPGGLLHTSNLDTKLTREREKRK